MGDMNLESQNYRTPTNRKQRVKRQQQMEQLRSGGHFNRNIQQLGYKMP